jgi:hypothetical protein
VRGSGDYRALAEAYSELLAQLAQRIAGAVTEQAATERKQAAQHLFQY